MIRQLNKRITVEELISLLSELPDKSIVLCANHGPFHFCIGDNHKKKSILSKIKAFYKLLTRRGSK